MFCARCSDGSQALPPLVAQYVAEAVNSYMKGSLDEDMASFCGAPDETGELSVDDFTPPSELPPEVVESLSFAVGAIAGHFMPSPAFDERR